MEKTKTVDKALKFLSDSIQNVQMTDGFSEVLNDAKLDHVYCSALNLSTSVTEYLTIAITYFVTKEKGELHFRIV
jgi:hypothetical protein